MTERREYRFETSQRVGLTILCSSPGGPGTHVPASVVNISGRGMRLTTESAVPIGSLVRIDLNDNILLGEVCHLNRIGPASFACGVRLEHSLTGVSGLSKLIAGIMGPHPEQAPEPPFELPLESQMLQAPAPKEHRGLRALLGRRW